MTSKPRDAARNAQIARLADSGVSYAEIAKLAGISRGAVAGVLHRAKNGAALKLSDRHARGETHYRSKLTDAQIELIRERRRNGDLLTQIAAAFDIDISTVSRIANGKSRMGSPA